MNTKKVKKIFREIKVTTKDIYRLRKRLNASDHEIAIALNISEDSPLLKK